MLLTKCCCCCNLRYGYLTYGILSMAGRLIACLGLYYTSVVLTGSYARSSEDPNHLLLQTISFYSGWIITSAVCLYFTLKGIVQERSILIFPYLVILMVEFLGFLFTGIIATIVATPYYLIILPFAIAIRVYEFWCLISLYQHMKSDEKVRHVGNRIPLKTV